MTYLCRSSWWYRHRCRTRRQRCGRDLGASEWVHVFPLPSYPFLPSFLPSFLLVCLRDVCSRSAASRLVCSHPSMPNDYLRHGAASMQQRPRMARCTTGELQSGDSTEGWTCTRTWGHPSVTHTWKARVGFRSLAADNSNRITTSHTSSIHRMRVKQASMPHPSPSLPSMSIPM